MKNGIFTSLLIISFLLFSTSCQNEPHSIVPKTSRGSARYDLEEVTVTAYRDYSNSNVFETIYKLSIGNDYHVESDPYTAFTNEYAGEDIDAIPGIMDLVLTKLNAALRSHNINSFKDGEMAILRTLSIKQVFLIYSAIESANNLANVSMRMFNEPSDNGYSNAFRHFYLAFGLARAAGPDVATQFLNAHEAGEVGLPTEMDANNNAYAIYLFRNNFAGTDYITFNYLMGLARNGQLWTIQNGACDRFPYTSGPNPNIPQN